MEMDQLRANIDEIDAQLVPLFVQRMEVCAQVAQYKKEHGLPIHVPAREEAILQTLSRQAGPEMEQYVRGLYETIFRLSRDYQSSQAAPRCGLLGRTLGHSYSPQIHALLGTYSYGLFQREPEELEQFLRRGEFDAINVTIPYKKAVIPYLDGLDETARRLGSVNTIVRRQGQLFGYNTDYAGFAAMVRRSGIRVADRKVLVLGTGGTSVTAQAVLKDLGAQVVVISRSGEENYQNLSRHADARVIVNTTPVGMYPDTGKAPLDIRQFPHLEGVLDVIYNPSRTRLLLDAQALGIPGENGLWMLVAQAKRASELFTGRTLPDSLIEQVHHAMKSRMENLILIGMPGCGKTTIGRLLAERTGRRFADGDEMVQTLAGKSIPALFREDGQEVFRCWEHTALEQLGRESGLVIATGGGCVTRQENYSPLHQNGTIIWLQRELCKLPTEGRPLSQATELSRMYTRREPVYRSFADVIVVNEGSPEETVNDILRKLEAEI